MEYTYIDMRIWYLYNYDMFIRILFNVTHKHGVTCTSCLLCIIFKCHHNMKKGYVHIMIVINDL